MSEASEEPQPRRFQVTGRYIQVRVRNLYPTYPYTGPWMSLGLSQGRVFAEDEVHPDDLAHLVQARMPPAYGGGPLIEEIQTPALWGR